MSADDSSRIIVSDSEAEETLIFNPFDTQSTAACVEENVLLPGETLDVPTEDCPACENGKRFLRKRKAIQRMPYSLDRIKHRQLLQGFDMTGFDTISEELRLPSPPRVQSERTEIRKHDLSELRETKQDSGDDESDRTSTSEEDMMKFRGKMVNMKTGFRGVLPRIAWEKALQQPNSTAGTSKRQRPSLNHKGVAKKKVAASETKVNQDDLLINDFISSPDEEVDQEDHFHLHEKPDENSLQELEMISEHYHQRYDNFYLSDDELNDEHADNLVIEINQKKSTDIQLIPRDDTELSDSFEQSSVCGSDIIELGAVEYNRDAIDTMLSKGRKKNHGNIVSSRGKGRKRVDSLFKKKIATSRVIHHKRSVRKIAGNASQSTLPLVPYLSAKTDLGKRDVTQRNIGGQNKQNESSKNSKKIDNTIGPFAPLGTKNNRRARIFSTVIETPSDKYALPKHSFSKPDESGIKEINSDDDEVLHQASLVALDSLFTGKPVIPPDTITVSLSDKHYTLSKFLRNDTPLTLSRIFDHIIENGITDKELLQVSESLTLFLLHLNHLGVTEVVSVFHKKFRSKVNILREKAKPIHFYQIATCQLMLLETANYADMSSLSVIEIKSNILNHVVSFYKLLAYCYESVSKSDMTYLFQSCDILSKVVHLIDMKGKLWEKLIEQSFQPEICFLLLNAFPTDQPQWKILKTSQDYASLVQAFRFIEYCHTTLCWENSKELLFLFDRIFKKRRYEDFVEEDSSKNSVLGPSRELTTGTLFNRFLCLFQETALTHSIVERITPIGEFSVKDSPVALINRLNLLIILARSSNIGLEKKMENLVRPVLTTSYLSQQNEQSLKKVGQSILNAILSLAEVNRSRNLTFKGKILVATFKKLIYEEENLLLSAWTNFLAQLIPIIEKFPKSKPLFLKEFYYCIILMAQKEVFTKSFLQVLQLYLRNLPILGAAWAQANILQVIKGKVNLSTNWIDHYCTVGKYLIQEDSLSWWSFYMYNDVAGSLTNRFYFYCKILQLCDSQSFELIKRSMFETATEYIFQNDSRWFQHFLCQLLSREHSMVIDYVYGKMATDSLLIVKKFVWTLNKLSYNDLLLDLISALLKYHQHGMLQRKFVSQIVEYLNLNFVDYVKSSHDFSLLKRELGISDIETEKSAFRDVFKSHQHSIQQACFIESGLIHACYTGEEEVNNYMEKLKSLFSFTALPNFFHVFIKLIAAHMQSESAVLLTFKLQIGGYLLFLINEVLRAKYFQVTPGEFLELCRLHKILCSGDSQQHQQESKQEQYFKGQNIQFQIYVLNIAHGFSDYHFLAQRSKEFLAATIRPGEPLDGELSAKIDDIARQYIDLDLHVKRFRLQTDIYTLMAKLQDMVVNIS